VSSKSSRAVRIAASAAVLSLLGSALVGCSSDGRETIRFTFSKREAIEFMTKLVADYNASQDDVRVEIDTSGVDVVSASFVRGNPPDIMLANYNYEVARFVQRCALSDLGGTDPRRACARICSRSWSSTGRARGARARCPTR